MPTGYIESAMRFLLFLTFLTPLMAKPLALETEAKAAVIMNADTGAVLYAKNPHTLSYPASTTKIGTFLYLLKAKGIDLNREVAADADSLGWITSEEKKKANYKKPAYWLEKGGTHYGIKNGEILTVRDLIRGLMIVSGNDAANVLACYAGGTIPTFCVGMNQYLKGIGCKHTSYNNPHGLHHPDHVTTAYDLALMGREGLKYSFFREVVSTAQFTRPKTNKQESTPLICNNLLIVKGKKAYDPRVLGIKTGYTAAAGYTIVSAAQKGGRTVVIVLLGLEKRKALFAETTRLLDRVFKEQPVKQKFLKAGKQHATLDIPGAVQSISTQLEEDVELTFYPSELPDLHTSILWNPPPLPIQAGSVIGDIQLVDEEGEVYASQPLLASATVEKTLWLRLQEMPLWIPSVVALVSVIFLTRFF